MQLRKQGHCSYKCEYHLVIVTKYRRKIFQEGSFSYFCKLMKGIIHDGMPEVVLLEVNHDKDHIHMLLSIPPKMRISDVVCRIKSTTGLLLKRKFEYMRKAYWVLMVYGLMDILFQRLVLTRKLLKNILSNREKKTWGKRSLYSA